MPVDLFSVAREIHIGYSHMQYLKMKAYSITKSCQFELPIGSLQIALRRFKNTFPTI